MRVFEVLMYFVNHEDEIVKEKALSGLGKTQWLSCTGS